jgi:hypothetical protein
MSDTPTHASRLLELIAQYPGVAIAAVVIFFSWLYGHRPRNPNDEQRGFWHFGEDDEADDKPGPADDAGRRKRPF